MTRKIGVCVPGGNDGKGGLGGKCGKGDLTMRKEDAIRDKEKESGILLSLLEKRSRGNSSPEVSLSYQQGMIRWL